MHFLALGPGARAVYTTASSPALCAPDTPLSFDHANANLQQRREALGEITGGRWLWARQTHSTTIITAAASLRASQLSSGDAIITLNATQIPAVVTADCLPVLLASADGKVRAAVHAGRRGLLAGIIPATITRMRQLTGQQLYAAFGPHICQRCYEVSPELANAAKALLPAACARSRWGSAAIDLAGGAKSQLADLGVKLQASGPCTLEDANFHSYRRDATALRIASGAVAGS